MLNTIEAEATLENCRALIDEINAGLSAKEPFINVSSAAELLLYLELAASLLKKSGAHARESGGRSSSNYLSLHRRDL
jgi:hypothetical protein